MHDKNLKRFERMPIPRRSISAIDADQLGWFEGSMYAYMAYMECMGIVETIIRLVQFLKVPSPSQSRAADGGL